MMKFDYTKHYDFSNLPPHVLVNIMLRLKLPDFKNAVQTCKLWYYASCDPQITRHILLNGLRDSANIEYLRRPIQNLRLNQVNLNKFDFRKLLTKFGHTITDLEIRLSTLAFTRIFEIFVYLPNVRTLQIYLGSNYFSAQNFHSCKVLQKHRTTISKNLGQIKYLKMHIRMRDLQVVKLFLSQCKNIERFHWNETIYLPHNQIEFICDYLLEPHENPVITNITDLLIGCIHRNDNQRFLMKLVNVSLPNLRRLHIKEISESFYDYTFREFCKVYRNLEELTISCCNDQHLDDICKYMHNLKSLRLDRCIAQNLAEIRQLTQLESLHLERFNNIRDDKLIDLLRLKLRNLTKLSINYVDENVLKVICENYKNLEELDLERVATKNCKPIFYNLLNLKILKLYFNMPAPCNSSRMDILADCNITRLTKLEELFVSCWLPGITPALVQQLPKLQRSCLEDTWDRTDAELAAWALAMERRAAIMEFERPPPEVEDPEYELCYFDWYNSIF